MRGELPSVHSPRPVGQTLPSIYLDDSVAQGLCETFDRMLAPAFFVLDCFPAYLDPSTAPADSLSWLAGWIGLTLEGHETPDKKRELIATGAELLRRRGTPQGMREAVIAAFGVDPEIRETGGVETSHTHGGSVVATGVVEHMGSSDGAGSSEGGGAVSPIADVGVTVTLRVGEPDSIDVRRLDAVVAQMKPAHLTHQVQVVQA